MAAKALVTGGAGFIGSNLVEALLSRGVDVVVLDNFSTGSLDNLPASQSHLKVVKGDICDYEAVKEASRGVDVVFHLAAQVGNVASFANPKESMDINAKGTVHILQACHENNVPQVVYSSSCAIFGETKYAPLDELHPLNPVSPYGVTKLAGEQICLSLGNYRNIAACCLRYFNVYGKRQRFNPYGNVLPIFAKRLNANQPLIVYGDGNQTRDFIDVRDVVAANLLVFEKRSTGLFNIGTGISSSVNDLVAAIKEAVGTPLEVSYQPPRIGEVRDSVANIQKAKIELGFSPAISLKQGVAEYLKWFNLNTSEG